MGVPRLYKWLYERYGKYITTHNIKQTNIVSVDNVFIDANAIIHNCAQKIFNYGPNKRFINAYSSLSEMEKNFLVYNRTYDVIVQIIEQVVPHRLLYIAIDGSAPAGKVMQQRQRRFVSAKNSISNVDEREFNFNSNCISAGTDFMKKLKLFLIEQIMRDYKKLPPKVIFSTSDVPGEGEHKIMEYIKNNVPTTQSNCMYGPDGDLIMLTLGATEHHEFYLLRPEHESPFINNLLHIGDIRKELVEDLKGENTHKGNVINDFVLLGFLVGNDFLPKLQMFEFVEDGLDLAIDIYRHYGKHVTYYDEKGDVNIDYKELMRILKKIKEKEYEYILSQTSSRLNNEKFTNHTLLKCVTEIKNGNEVNKSLNFAKYRKDYNNKIFTTSNASNISQVVDDYVKTLEWIIKYYTFNVPPSYEWCYLHYYAPLVEDLVEFEPKSFEFSSSEPHNPHQQLLMILPFSSKDLLPNYLKHLFVEESPISKYYSLNFSIDYEGKHKEYQGVALLPIIDYNEIKSYYIKALKGNTERIKNHTYVFDKSDTMNDYILKGRKVPTKYLVTKI